MNKKKRIPCDVYSRIIGYYRPTRDWNKGAQTMFADRVNYTMPKLNDAIPKWPASPRQTVE